MSGTPSFKEITTFVFDMDGVLTDGTLILLPNQMPVRTMHIKDGYALQLAIKKGYRIMVISGSVSEPGVERLNKLGIESVLMNVQDKRKLLQDLIKQNSLQSNEVLYMGDDMPDYAAMMVCGLPCSPADAVDEIKSISSYISPYAGGKGCVRDVLEKVMKARGDWEHLEMVSSL
jgi:3-deoxy-D-manno-octulosonate 8-phosphate phosphatase (KDO 8-P phosphatase)